MCEALATETHFNKTGNGKLRKNELFSSSRCTL